MIRIKAPFFSATKKLISAEFIGAIGNEILNIVIVWFIVDKIGYNGSYLIALTLISAILSGLLGRYYLKNFSHIQKTI